MIIRGQAKFSQIFNMPNDIKKQYVYAFITGLIAAFFLLLTAQNIPAIARIPYKEFFIIGGIPLAYLLGAFLSNLVSALLHLGFVKQGIRFLMVGFMNTAVDFGIINVLISFTGITKGIFLIVLNAISFSVAVTNSYFWNRLWVFEDKEGGGISEFSKFIFVTVTALGLNSAIVYTLATHVDPFFELDQKTWVNLAKALATGVTLFWNFFGYKLIVFKK